jgi:hypothetical protein
MTYCAVCLPSSSSVRGSLARCSLRINVCSWESVAHPDDGEIEDGTDATSEMGHSRRNCHVRSLVGGAQYQILPRPTDVRSLCAVLHSICKQQAQPRHLRPGLHRFGGRDALAVRRSGVSFNTPGREAAVSTRAGAAVALALRVQSPWSRDASRRARRPGVWRLSVAVGYFRLRSNCATHLRRRLCGMWRGAP